MFDAETASNERARLECQERGYAWDEEHRAQLIADAQKLFDEADEEMKEEAKQDVEDAKLLELCPAHDDIMAELKQKQERCR